MVNKLTAADRAVRTDRPRHLRAVVLLAQRARGVAHRVGAVRRSPRNLADERPLAGEARRASRECIARGNAGEHRGRVALRHGRVALRHGRVALRRGRVALRRGRVALRRGRVALRRGRVALRRGRVALQRGRVALRRGRVALLHGRVALRRGRVALQRGRVALLHGRPTAAPGAWGGSDAKSHRFIVSQETKPQPTVIPSVESRDLGGWGIRHEPRAPPTQVPRLTLGMTVGTLVPPAGSRGLFSFSALRTRSRVTRAGSAAGPGPGDCATRNDRWDDATYG